MTSRLALSIPDDAWIPIGDEATANPSDGDERSYMTVAVDIMAVSHVIEAWEVVNVGGKQVAKQGAIDFQLWQEAAHIADFSRVTMFGRQYVLIMTPVEW